GNVGRYFLPVANVINIKQGGALLDARTFYGFEGWEIREHNGVEYAFPILGEQFGFDNSQGDGTVGDLRAEVDADMDQVYQDELTIWGDTDCDGVDDGYLTIDTAQAGYWTEADNYVYTDGEWEYVDSTPTGQRGWVKPRRTYKALEFQVDRAWDEKWMFNGSY